MLLLVLIFATVFAAPVKNLAGPVEEFHLHRIPDPATVLMSQRSASLNLWFSESEAALAGTEALSSTRFPIDGENEFVLSFASPIQSSVRVELLSPEGKPVDPSHVDVKKGSFEIDDNKKHDIPTTTYIVTESEKGWYTFNIYANGLLRSDLTTLTNNPRPDGVLTFINNDEYKIHSHVQSYLLRTGEEIGLVSTFGSDTVFNLVGSGSSNVRVVHATMEVITPSGEVLDVKMKDDGLSGDFAAKDGVYGAKIKASQPGVYILQANMDGFLADVETPFQRTTEHTLRVSAATVRLSGTAKTANRKDGTVDIEIGLKDFSGETTSIRAYAEVWGTDETGTMKPACWIGGVVESIESGSAKLVLDEKWLIRAGVQGPLTLKNVYISDLATSFPIDTTQTTLQVAGSHRIQLRQSPLTVTKITKEMRFGKNPLKMTVNKTRDGASPNLVLLPGYCADVNPWSRNSHHFDSGFFPVDFGNHPNDAYAKKIMSQIEAQGIDTFGLVGHSQGGMISLHIHNFYWTGLAKAEGHRLIQTVGTPWRGSTAAGSAANLGDIFGVGCGSNVDLSIDGAANWLTGVSAEARSDVHYYTTTYKTGNFFGDWCSLPMNLILQWPNDGLVELEYAQLPGALAMGNKEKWCHTTEMGYPPQYDDQERNAEINKNAAR